MKVKNIMSADVVSVNADATLNEAMRLMADRDLGALPVVDTGGRVIAMITDRDVALATYRHNELPAKIAIRDAMSRGVIVCSPDDRVPRVEHLMSEHQVRRIPVVDDSGRPTGIVTLGDLARAAWQGSGRALSRAVVHAVESVTRAAA